MKRIITYIFVVCALGLFSYARQNSLQRDIHLLLQNSGFQGTALVAQDGKVIFHQGYGFANREHAVTNKPETVFRIGSITKTFTAIAILQLQEKKLLDVHETIDRFLPHFPNGKLITIHHLLSHTSGIPSITELDHFPDIQKENAQLDKTLGYFKDLPLEFPPGSDASYSDSGYLVLGAIIEKASGLTYHEYVQKEISQPSGMTSTSFDDNSIISHKATGYAGDKQADYIDMHLPHASGALVSTADDLHRLMQALQKGLLLTRSSLDSMHQIQGSNPSHQIAYGYGLRIGPQNKGMEGCLDSISGHFGTINGFEAALIYYMDCDLTIILLSNQEGTPVRSLHRHMADLVFSYWR